jgi:hypothetical protein
MSVEMHSPVVVTDGGPWALHDVACPVCQERKAVLDLSGGIFQPCWRCQRDGWATVRRRAWFRRAFSGAGDTTGGDE